MKKLIMSVVMISALCACQSTKVPQNDAKPTEQTPVKKEVIMPIIGGVERVYIGGMKVPLLARIDTGAATSSIDAENIVPFERDGEKWVSFEIVNRSNGARLKFEKKIKRKALIKRTGKDELRYVVNLKVKMGKDVIDTDFTLNDREKFDYQVLIGRNIISGRYLVDASISNTLR
jgi:hypothetical protein